MANIFKVNDEGGEIIKATSVVLTEGMRPRRVVLRRLPDKFVTHVELMEIIIEYDGIGAKPAVIVARHFGYDSGHYFDFGTHCDISEQKAYNDAFDDFDKRAGDLGRSAHRK